MPASIGSGDPTLQYVSGVDPLTNQGTGQTGETLTTNTPDPWRNFLMGLIGQQASSTKGAIPDYTMAALENFTANPSAAADFYPDMARPLLEANKVSQDRQTTALTDLFRKAGGTANGPMGSGAFAQAGRQLVGDFARQDQEVLAKNYAPLTSQISDNMTNNIKAGLSVPDATASQYRNLVPLVTGLSPLQTRTQTTGVTQQIGAPGGALTPQQQQNLVNQAVGNYASLPQTSPYYRT